MKRILALDGGGIRALFSLQVLARIEQLFRQERDREDMVLADEFDLFAGTSSGAIVATGLAWGMAVADIEKLYATRGSDMFTRAPWYQRWKSKYRAEAMASVLRIIFSEDGCGEQPALLGSARLRTLLLVVLRNASTGSAWPLTNNPRAKFNDRKNADCNLDIPIWQLLRASSAAPTYFPPQEIQLGGHRDIFVDGGTSSFNNPALIAVLHATLPQYRLGWPASRADLHVVSIGTGAARARLDKKSVGKINVLDQISYLFPALSGAAVIEQDLLCRVLGDCLHGAPIDSELGNLNTPTMLTPDEQKFSYVRYDRSVEDRAALDDLSMIPLLQAAGKRYAEEHVRLEHLYPRAAS